MQYDGECQVLALSAMPRVSALTTTLSLVLAPYYVHMFVVLATCLVVGRCSIVYVVYHSVSYAFITQRYAKSYKNGYLCRYILDSMTRFTTLALAALLMMVGCTAKTNKSEEQKAETIATPVKTTFAELYDYRVVAEYPHSSRSYTQGLQYVDGTMWEGTGQECRSHLQRISLTTGKVDVVASLPDDEFGEGITLYKDRIYQLTWLSRKAYIYDLEGRKVEKITRPGLYIIKEKKVYVK